MTRDGQRVLALLQTLNHHLPGPATNRSNPLCYRPDSGEAPSTTRECRPCAGKGVYGPHRRKCYRCHGAGTITVDEYTGREMSTVKGHLRLMTSNELDTQLTHLATLEAIRQGSEAIDAGTALMDRRAAHRRSGSYDDLEVQLLRLSLEKPAAYGFVLLFLIYDSPAIRTDRVQRVLDAACELLAQLMPKPIRVPAWATTDTNTPGRGRWANGHTQGQRNQEVRRLRDTGLSLTKIGQRVGLTKQRVQQILKEAA